jgi:hypothetical protein
MNIYVHQPIWRRDLREQWSIDIESPDGSVYAVKGLKHMSKMVPQCGWKAFVDAHRILV